MISDFTIISNAYMPLRELVLTTLRQAILKGEIQPGERLMELQLADKMGVSRTPIREAIRRLSDEGLVTLIPRKGAIVAGISEKLLLDVLEVRMTLEQMAYECAFMHITDEELDQLDDIIDQLAEEKDSTAVDKVRYADLDEQFHNVIYEASQNDKLKEILYNLRENMYRYRIEYSRRPETREQAHREHLAIRDSLRQHDFEAGMKVMKEHIRNQKNILLAKIKEDAESKEVFKSLS